MAMRFSLWVLVFTLVAACLLGWRIFVMLPDGRLHVHVLDVGQGDSMFLVSPSGKQILIDGGPDLSTLERIGRTMPFFDRTIDLLILTHPDQDHITALPDVLRRYSVQQVLFGGTQKDTSRYQAFLWEVTQNHVPLILPDPTKDIDIGDGLVLDVLWPQHSIFGTSPTKANNTSIVLRAHVGNQTILFTGDIEEETEHAILRSGQDIQSITIKVPHHGSRTSSSTGFLLAVQPEKAIFSVGRHNRFGHPHKEVIDRYNSLGIDTQNTARQGTVSLAF